MAVTIKVTGTPDRVIDLGNDAALGSSAVNLDVEEARIYPATGPVVQPQEVVIGGGENVEVEIPAGTWYYALIDNIEQAYEGAEHKWTYVVADCIPLTYFEAHATNFASFYPEDIDNLEEFDQPSSRYVYRTDKTTNEAAELRNLRGNQKNAGHREAVRKLLGATDRLRLVRLKLAPEGLPAGQSLEIQCWHLFNLADDGAGLEAEVITHAQIARGSPAPVATKTFVQEILFLHPARRTARRLSRVISLDFVPEIDFGSEGNEGDPPLTPVIVPAGPGAVDEEAIPALIAAARVDGNAALPLIVNASGEAGMAVSITFDRPTPQPVISNLQTGKKAGKQIPRTKRTASPKAKKSQSRATGLKPIPFKIYEDPEPDVSATSSSTSEIQQPKQPVQQKLAGSPKRRRPLANITNVNKGK